MIEFIKGDVLRPSTTKRLICHIVNNKGGFGKGFALQVANQFPLVQNKYKEWYAHSVLHNANRFKLGDIQTVRIDDHLTFVNMLAQDGYASKENPMPLNMSALMVCLTKVRDLELKHKTEIWMPYLIGCGLGGGDEEAVTQAIEFCLETREVKIFEL